MIKNHSNIALNFRPPFGVTLVGREFTSDKYRYGFQGSEKDDEVKGKGNSYNTEYRILDVRLGRWLSIDPVISPYDAPFVSMGNNPIMYVDALGNTFEEGSKETVEKFKGETNVKIDAANKELQVVQEQIKTIEAVVANKDALKMIGVDIDPEAAQAQMDILQEKEKDIINVKNELENSLVELNELEKSKQVFRIKGKLGKEGETYYNTKTNEVVFYVNKNRIHSVAHEFKHGFQYLAAELDFQGPRKAKKQSGGPWLDINDEISAYKRTYAFNTNLVQTKLSISNYDQISSKTIKAAFPDPAAAGGYGDLPEEDYRKGKGGDPAKINYVNWVKTRIEPAWQVK